MQQGTCERCGAGFDATHPLKRYCSKRCQRAAEKARYRLAHSERARCKACGLGFQRSKVDGRKQVYCSLSCRDEARSIEYQGRGDILGNLAEARRVNDHGIGIYYGTLRADPCAYCDGLGGDIDHIDPRSLEGANHWENYTGTCSACNSLKSDKTLLAFLGWRQSAAEFDGWRVMAGNTSTRGDHRSKEAAGVG